MFLDLAGELWEQGALVDKVATSFTSSQTEHGGQESTILALNNTFYHWGAIVLPLGYTVHEVFNGGGNPYGASYTSGRDGTARPANRRVCCRTGWDWTCSRVIEAHKIVTTSPQSLWRYQNATAWLMRDSKRCSSPSTQAAWR